jgi:plasmid maintenance system antidote protein VapI
MAKLLEDIHPGEILAEDFMKPIALEAARLMRPASRNRHTAAAN